jgi:hypothetical protein
LGRPCLFEIDFLAHSKLYHLTAKDTCGLIRLDREEGSLTLQSFAFYVDSLPNQLLYESTASAFCQEEIFSSCLRPVCLPVEFFPCTLSLPEPIQRIAKIAH